VRIVVPSPHGGPNDIATRLVAQWLTESPRQPFIIDNRPGVPGMTGTDAVAKSPADGYTLPLGASVHVIYPAIFRKVPFAIRPTISRRLHRSLARYSRPGCP